jgi:hypothetical protein
MKPRIVCPRAVIWRGRSRARLLALSAAGALAITAVTALGPGGPGALAFPLFNPAITVADGNSVIAVHTSGNGLRFYWNEFGTNNWHGEQVAANGTTFSDPSIAQVGNTVVIAAEGIFNSLDLYWQTNGSSGWNEETVAGIRLSTSWWATNGTAGWVQSPMPDGDTGASSIVAYAGGVYVVARELFGYMGVSTSVGDSGTWTSSQVIYKGLFSPGLTVVGNPSVTINDGSVNIATEDVYGNLSFFWQDSSGAFHQETVDTAANL